MDPDFFQVVSVQEFLDLVQRFPRISRQCRTKTVEVGREVLAENVLAPEDLPLFSRSSMDGYALRAQDVFGATEFNPAYLDIVEHIPVGVIPEKSLGKGECAAIVTGGALPVEADAVVMQEHTHMVREKELEVRRTVAPGENIMHLGEDCARGEQVLARGDRIRAQEIALLAALGQEEITVFPGPRVGIISSGDELVPLDRTPKAGQIRDVNSQSLRRLITDFGGVPQEYGIVRDQLEPIKNTLHRAWTESDLVLISGGSSVGTRDLTLTALQELENSQILAHGVSISPGKPTILAAIGEKPVLGLPGQVTSAQVVFLVLVVPLLRHLAGEDAKKHIGLKPSLRARLGRNLASKQGREDYVRVRVQCSGDDLPTAVPLSGKSGLLKTMLQADGLIRIPAGQEGVLKNSEVKVFVFG